MPQAGVPARARRRYAAPWWEELDREAFRFPTAYEVKPARRAVARTEDGSVRATAPATDQHPPVAHGTRPAANGRASAAHPRASAAEARAAAVHQRASTDGRALAATRRVSGRVAGPSSRPRPVAAAPAPPAAAPSPVRAPTPAGVPVSAAAERAAARAGVAEGERRTVIIRGYGAERNLPVARPTLRRHERPGFRPDRAALWAVFLGLVLILVAVASAHGAVLH
jgi:hypothetical protein